MARSDDSQFHVFHDAAEVAEQTAHWLLDLALARRSRVAVCLSGGSTPKLLYATLASPAFRGRFPWPQAHWFWGDERFVAMDHPDSNYLMARRAMLDAVPVPAANIHPVPTHLESPDAAAAAYERDLKAFYGQDKLERDRPLFDITLLGVGDDGHTASLFPGTSVLAERTRWVTSITGARPEPRITLTYPALQSSRHVAFLVCGSSKRKIVTAICQGEDYPAGHIRPDGELHWFLDQDAAPAGLVHHAARDAATNTR